MKITCKKTIAAVILLFIAASCVYAEDTGGRKYLKETLILLPGKTKASFNWIIPPRENETPGADISFRMGGNGNIWLGRDGKYLLDPVSGLMLGINENFDDFAPSESGSPVFISRGYLCVIPAIKSPKTANTNLSLQPVAKLPADDCRIFPAHGGFFYIAGKINGAYSVFTAGGPEGMIKVEAKGKAFVYKKLFTTPAAIAAVAGDGKTTFVAMERLVISLKKGSGKADPFFIHRQDITGLAYDPDAGLFYCTENGVGYAAAGGNIEFLRVKKPEIAVSGGKLYVYLKESNALLEVSGIKEFRSYIKKSGDVKNNDK
jgi:hypothetical protein